MSEVLPMCERIVIDTDRMYLLLPEKQNKTRDTLLKAWIDDGHGVPCYTTYGEYGKELGDVGQFKSWVETLFEVGKAFRIPDSDVDSASRELTKNEPKRHHDDHVLSLVIASKAKILCTGDGPLKKRFTNIIPRITSEEVFLYPLDDAPCERKLFLEKHQCLQ